MLSKHAHLQTINIYINSMTPLIRSHGCSGIAIAPILFIVAIMAVLATAISSASGTFSAGSEQEKASTLAEVVISQCKSYKDALLRMMALGCDINRIDWRPNTSWPSGSTWNSGDFTGGNGTNKDGNGTCALHHVNGGGMNYQRLPSTALMSDAEISAAYSAASINGWIAGESINSIAFAGYPYFHSTTCWGGLGTCTQSIVPNGNAHPILMFWGMNKGTCDAVNLALKNTFTADSTTFTLGSAHVYSFYAGGSLRGLSSYVVNSSFGGMPFTSPSAGCAKDWNSQTSGSYLSYKFACVLYPR